jgi:hypothetical protein
MIIAAATAATRSNWMLACLVADLAIGRRPVDGESRAPCERKTILPADPDARNPSP